MYSFLYADMQLLTQGQGLNSFNTPYTKGTVYQAVDSATDAPIPDPTELVPYRYVTIFWGDTPDAVKYKIDMGGKISYVTAGAGRYSKRSGRLESGEHIFNVVAIDSAGNESEIKNLTHLIDDVPPPINSLVLTQSGNTNITATITPPTGW